MNHTRRERLETAHLWADLVSKVVGGLALVVAAWWTYTNFTVERTHDPTMEVSVAPSVQPLSDDRVLLNVDVFLRNIGKVAIFPRFPAGEGDRNVGLEISIVEIEPFSTRTPAPADPSGAPEPRVRERRTGDHGLPWFDWTTGDGDPRLILIKRNLLASNEDFRHGRYQLNPGVRYREPFACIVERNKLYAIRARFWTEEGSVADLVYIDTVRVGGGS